MSSGILNKRFPFSAVTGMDDVKRALECIVTDSDLKGLLIKGPGGTAKTLLVRSFVNLLPDKDIVNVPLNVTDEQLFGGMDMEHAITHGKAIIKDGLLKRAHNNILYLDNINLFDPRILNSIMDCVGSGRVVIEREGISSEYECETTVIATMDPAERSLSDHALDRFDMCVQTRSADSRKEIHSVIRSNMDFDSDPDGFAERYAVSDRMIAELIDTAKTNIVNVSLNRSALDKISRVCIELEITSSRGDVSTARVARALAALDGKKRISDEHIKDAAVLCLLHRRTAARIIEVAEEIPEIEKVIEAPEELKPKRINPENEKKEPITGYSDGKGKNIKFGDQKVISEITGAVKSRLDDLDTIESIRLHELAGTSKRKDMVTKKHSGRSRSYRMPDGKSTDPAFSATVKAAAPYQSTRDKKGLSIAIEPRDIRDKIRVKRDSCSFLFAVDVSGSLVKGGRMNDIKDGVKAMLIEGYVHRDKIALMTFTYDGIVISVPFTRSLENIYDVLDDTPTGGCTPLGAALLKMREYLMNYIRKNPEEHCYVILITDGEANEPVIKGNIPEVELKRITETMNIPNTEWIVVDSGLFANGANDAFKLARLLNGRYIKLEDLKAV